MISEATRRADFRAHPGFSNYLATMLKDMQFREAEEAFMEDREERDTDTIYTLPDDAYTASLSDYRAFVAAAGADAEAFADALSWDQIGSDFWLARVGHGAGFWDRGQGDVGDRLTDLAARAGTVDPYFGDDRKVYLG